MAVCVGVCKVCVKECVKECVCEEYDTRVRVKSMTANCGWAWVTVTHLIHASQNPSHGTCQEAINRPPFPVCYNIVCVCIVSRGCWNNVRRGEVNSLTLTCVCACLCVYRMVLEGPLVAVWCWTDRLLLLLLCIRVTRIII